MFAKKFFFIYYPPYHVTIYSEKKIEFFDFLGWHKVKVFDNFLILVRIFLIFFFGWRSGSRCALYGMICCFGSSYQFGPHAARAADLDAFPVRD